MERQYETIIISGDKIYHRIPEGGGGALLGEIKQYLVNNPFKFSPSFLMFPFDVKELQDITAELILREKERESCRFPKDCRY